MPESDRLDVIVVGGGPAGSACACMLARGGLAVAVVEGTTFRDKRIGETTPPGLRRELARLGFSDLLGVDVALPSAGVQADWGGPRPPGPTPALFAGSPPGWQVDRAALDRMLFEHAGRAGARLCPGSRVEQVRWDGEEWSFVVSGDGGPRSFRAQIAVEATGRNGRSAFAPDASRTFADRLTSWILHDLAIAGGPLVEPAPDGWWYSVGVPGGSGIAAFFTDADLVPIGRDALADHLVRCWRDAPATAARTPTAPARLVPGDWRVVDARTSLRRVAADERWIAVGDALLALDPLCGRGIAEAVSHGIESARLIMDDGSLRSRSAVAWAERAALRYRRFLMKRLAVYSEETRFANRPFWRRRHSH